MASLPSRGTPRSPPDIDSQADVEAPAAARVSTSGSTVPYGGGSAPQGDGVPGNVARIFNLSVTWYTEPLLEGSTLSTVVVACFAFLSGSIPFGVLLSRLVAGRDVRSVGSGNIGAANVARAAGMGTGIAVAVLDVTKGMVPVWIGALAGLENTALALVALMAVIGHDFSLFLRFRGGKGVATTLGVILVLAPTAATAAIVTWVVVVFLWRYTSLASLVALALLPLFLAVTGQPAIYVVLGSLLFVLSALKHWENIVRLANGREPKIRQRVSDAG